MSPSASPLWRLFTWEEPLSSGTGLAFGLSAFLAHTLGYTLAGVVVQLALAALVISAGTALYSAMMEGAALPQPRIVLHADALRRASSVAGERAVAALERINELLAWRDVAASGRALAYAWFAYRTIWLLAPHRLVAAWILAFALAPVYVIFSLPINAALALHVTPQVVALQAAYRSACVTISALVASNKNVAYVVLSAVGVLFVYVFLSSYSLQQLFTLSSCVVICLELLGRGGSKSE